MTGQDTAAVVAEALAKHWEVDVENGGDQTEFYCDGCKETLTIGMGDVDSAHQAHVATAVVAALAAQTGDTDRDCACGHDDHQHDREADLCMVCGDGATCDLFGCDCEALCPMGPTCPGGILARLAGAGCHRVAQTGDTEQAGGLTEDEKARCRREYPTGVPWRLVFALIDRILAARAASVPATDTAPGAFTMPTHRIGDLCPACLKKPCACPVDEDYIRDFVARVAPAADHAADGDAAVRALDDEWLLSLVLARYSYGESAWAGLDPEERNAIAEPYLPRARQIAPMVRAATAEGTDGGAG